MIGYYLVLDYGYTEEEDGIYTKGSIIIEQVSYGEWKIFGFFGWINNLTEAEVINFVS